MSSVATGDSELRLDMLEREAALAERRHLQEMLLQAPALGVSRPDCQCLAALTVQIRESRSHLSRTDVSVTPIPGRSRQNGAVDDQRPSPLL